MIDSPPVTPEDMTKLKMTLEATYDGPVNPVKMQALYELMEHEKWTKKRLADTTAWFLKHNESAFWAPAKWFTFERKLFGYTWYMEQIAAGVPAENIECYRVNGRALFKLKDGDDLPLEKIIVKTEESKPVRPPTKEEAEKMASMFGNLIKDLKNRMDMNNIEADIEDKNKDKNNNNMEELEF